MRSRLIELHLVGRRGGERKIEYLKESVARWKRVKHKREDDITLVRMTRSAWLVQQFCDNPLPRHFKLLLSLVSYAMTCS
ncbi:hypothetical protein CEXT_27601 [Caerostris extrusa]|uniref:Uncharacterized protein n=1 Tax=Caerostris extrusa TaxID=172846 RepID=A0AAV4XUK5_CAEEX|nr:hypothetical protein CEXT_27601 [Caerostris extrusa]